MTYEYINSGDIPYPIEFVLDKKERFKYFTELYMDQINDFIYEEDLDSTDVYNNFEEYIIDFAYDYYCGDFSERELIELILKKEYPNNIIRVFYYSDNSDMLCYEVYSIVPETKEDVISIIKRAMLRIDFDISCIPEEIMEDLL